MEPRLGFCQTNSIVWYGVPDTDAQRFGHSKHLLSAHCQTLWEEQYHNHNKYALFKVGRVLWIGNVGQRPAGQITAPFNGSFHQRSVIPNERHPVLVGTSGHGRVRGKTYIFIFHFSDIFILTFTVVYDLRLCFTDLYFGKALRFFRVLLKQLRNALCRFSCVLANARLSTSFKYG